MDLKDNQAESIRLNFLEGQRHWIFAPLHITIYGIKDKEKTKIKTLKFPEIIGNYEVEVISKTFSDQRLTEFNSLIIEIINRKELPSWRKRKNKKTMFMIDEIEIY